MHGTFGWSYVGRPAGRYGSTAWWAAAGPAGAAAGALALAGSYTYIDALPSACSHRAGASALHHDDDGIGAGTCSSSSSSSNRARAWPSSFISACQLPCICMHYWSQCNIIIIPGLSVWLEILADSISSYGVRSTASVMLVLYHESMTVRNTILTSITLVPPFLKQRKQPYVLNFNSFLRNQTILNLITMFIEVTIFISIF